MARDRTHREQWHRQPYGSVEIASMITGIRSTIATYDSDRREDLAAMRAIYLDRESERYAQLAFYRKRASRYNLTRGAVDATHAGTVTNRPRPKMFTVAGDHHAQRRTALRQKWLDGEYERLKMQQKAALLALDALIYGTGAIKFGHEDGKIVADRVWVGELWVDPQEAQKGRVRTLYQFHTIDRSTLIETYPDHAEALEAVAGVSNEDRFKFVDLEVAGLWESSDMIEVIEVWRLPTSSDPTPSTIEGRPPPGAGRRVVVCPGIEEPLDDEEWTHDEFPFAFLRFGIDPESFWGVSMVEQAAGMQSDLNELTSISQQTYEMFPPQLWVADGSGVDVGSQTDVIGAIRRCNPASGDIRTAVQMITGEVGGGLLNREATIADRFLPALGVDILGAAGEKPAGLNSGEALRNFKDFAGQRMIDFGRRYETAVAEEAARLILWWADQLADGGKADGLKVYGGKLGLELIDYRDTRPQSEDEVYVVRVKPGSMLPKDVSGRIQTILDLQAAGAPIDAVQLAEMMEMPDTDALLDRLSAGREIVRKAIDLCSDPDEEQPTAHAFWPRDWAMSELVIAIQKAETDGADEETMERLRALHGHLLSLPDPNAPPPAPPGSPELAMAPTPPPIGAEPMAPDLGMAPGAAPLPPDLGASPMM